MIYIDKYAYISALKDTAPAAKALLALVTLVVCIASCSFFTFGLAFGVMSYLTVFKANIPARYYGKLLLVPAAFLLMSVLGVVVSISSTAPAGPALLLGGWYIYITKAGLLQAAILLGRALAAVSALYFLVLTTPMRDIIRLLQACRVPVVLTELFTLVYRFIFLLLEKADIKRSSQQSRFGYLHFRRGCTSFGMLCASVFVESLEQSGRIYDAMLTKGYDGRLKFLPGQNRLTIAQGAAIAAFGGILVLAGHTAALIGLWNG